MPHEMDKYQIYLKSCNSPSIYRLVLHQEFKENGYSTRKAAVLLLVCYKISNDHTNKISNTERTQHLRNALRTDTKGNQARLPVHCQSRTSMNHSSLLRPPETST